MIALEKYFDHNSTTPLCEAAREAWLLMADEHWENPSSLYREAGLARRLLDDLREELAEELAVEDAERVVFTSGATEANNAVIHFWSQGPGMVAISSVEHPCVRAAAAGFFGRDRMIDIEVDPLTGQVNLDEVERIVAMGAQVEGVSVMAANNETGTIQPWDVVAELCREAGIPFHSDSTQWIGKEPGGGFSQIDFFTGSAHKFGGPKGVGFLVLPEDFDNCAFIGQLGGPQENGRRGGTEDLAGIAAMIAALKNSANTEDPEEAAARDQFEQALEEAGDFRIVGKRGPRLANTSMIILPHTRNLKWLTRLSDRGFGVSTGSACSAGAGNPSQVMMAMDLEYEEMSRVLRISGGPGQGKKEWMALFDAIQEVNLDLLEE
ncbi:MAG: aminotransferase class V-fold PLP-dependent enzyme [Verrucomicrobiales bacterium]|nr:aminotransferase class V-fold PLP-dependent enzyme [Verrucomicrobiales bacterium]